MQAVPTSTPLTLYLQGKGCLYCILGIVLLSACAEAFPAYRSLLQEGISEFEWDYDYEFDFEERRVLNEILPGKSYALKSNILKPPELLVNRIWREDILADQGSLDVRHRNFYTQSNKG